MRVGNIKLHVRDCSYDHTNTYTHTLQREQAALRAIEEQRMKQEKQRQQEETKVNLDYSLKLKMKLRAKAVQEELALDMKILEQMLSESSNEAMQHLQRKVRERLAMNSSCTLQVFIGTYAACILVRRLALPKFC